MTRTHDKENIWSIRMVSKLHRWATGNSWRATVPLLCMAALPAFDTRVQNSHALHARKLHKSPINSISDTPKLIRWALYQFLEMWWNTVCVTHLMLVHLECLPNTYEFTIISADISQYYMNQEIKVLPFPLLLNHPHLILDHCNGSNITSLTGLTQ